MSNQKRRVIYMTDQEWADVQSRAKERGLSASEYIRAAVAPTAVTPAFAQFRPAPKPKGKK